MIAGNLRPLGLALRPKILGFDAFGAAVGDPRRHIGILLGDNWQTDYPSGLAFFGPLFREGFGLDHSSVGANRSQLRRWGYRVRSVPTVTPEIEQCQPLVGADQFRCWASLDQRLMERVVPWVPYMSSLLTHVVSDRVVRMSFDQFASQPALDRFALRPEPSLPQASSSP